MHRLLGVTFYGAMAILATGCGAVTAADPDANGGQPADANSGDADTSIDADLSPDASPVPANLVFVTSSEHSGSLGGLAGADALCNARASEAGLAGSYVAWLSTATVDAKDRLGSASGWVRVDGRPFASTVSGLLAGDIYYPASLDEKGIAVNASVWTATRATGLFDANTTDCTGWTAAAPGQSAQTGATLGGFESFTVSGTRGCAAGNRLLCFGVDNQATVNPPNDVGRQAFVSTTKLNGAQGLAAYDTACNADATAAGLSGTFRAVMSNGAAPPVNRFNLAGATWVRPDGVKLFSAPGDMSNNNGMIAPIQVRADGQVVNSQVWTGSSGFGGTNPNCSSWSVASDSGIIGMSTFAGVNGAAFDGLSCTNLRPVY